MPRKKLMISMLEVGVHHGGWTWNSNTKPFEYQDRFERSGESLRVAWGLPLGVSSSFYFIQHRRSGREDLWIVQVGLREAPAMPGHKNPEPDVILPTRFGKPLFTFSEWFRDCFLLGMRDPDKSRVAFMRAQGMIPDKK